MKLDFTKGVFVQVGGELGRHNSLPIDNFIQFAQNLQNTILNIAKHDLPLDQPIDPDNFRLEITDFKKGSAVPQFAFTHRYQETLGETLSIHREKVSRRFEELMIIADEGNYTKIRLLYPEPAKRAVFVENLYSLSNDFGNSPVSFAEYSPESNQFAPIFRIKRFKAETKRELLADVIPSSNLAEEENTAYAKVRLKNDKKGKPRRLITQLYTQKKSH